MRQYACVLLKTQQFIFLPTNFYYISVFMLNTYIQFVFLNKIFTTNMMKTFLCLSPTIFILFTIIILTINTFAG